MLLYLCNQVHVTLNCIIITKIMFNVTIFLFKLPIHTLSPPFDCHDTLNLYTLFKINILLLILQLYYFKLHRLIVMLLEN